MQLVAPEQVIDLVDVGTISQATLELAIQAASEIIIDYTKADFEQNTHTELHDGGEPSIRFRHYPADLSQEIGVTENGRPLDRNVDFIAYKGGIARRGGRFAEGALNVEISYTAGYRAVPARVAVVCVRLVEYLLSNPTLLSETIGGYSYTRDKDAIDKILEPLEALKGEQEGDIDTESDRKFNLRMRRI